MKVVDIYVDGSFRDEQACWAFIVVENDKQVYGAKGRLSGPINEMRQIGGELKAVIMAVCYARRLNVKARIFYDYNGIENWVAEISGKKPWNTNNEWTTKYREWMLANRQYVDSFVKVKGHSGDKWNEEVDKLAALA